MQASVSTNSEIEGNILQEAYNNCGQRVSVSDQINIGDFTHDPPSTCPYSATTIKQGAAVDGSCLITSLQDSLAKYVQNVQNTGLSADAQAGLGIVIGSNQSNTKTNIAQKIANECNSVSADNAISVKNATSRACDFEAVQTANARQACEINNTQKLIADVASKAPGSKDKSIFESTGGKIVFISIGVILLIILIAGIVMIIKTSKKGEIESIVSTRLAGGFWSDFNTDFNTDFTTDSLGQKLNNNKSYIAIAIIVIFLLVLFFMGSRNTAKKNIVLSNDDMKSLHQQIQEVHQIAGVRPRHKGAIISDTRSDISDISDSTNSLNSYNSYNSANSNNSNVGADCESCKFNTNEYQMPNTSNYWLPSTCTDMHNLSLEDYYKPLL